MPIMRFDNPLNSEDKNFEQCLTYIQRSFPHEDESSQYKMARAVFAISEVFMNQIIPTVINANLKPSLN